MMLENLPPDWSVEHIVASVGLVADTHMPQRSLTLPACLPTLLAGVDLILHAGDVGELWVLDQLSAIAPVVAVHGNDDSKDAQRELPYQQVASVAGQRILLWHSHFPDRVDELQSRQDDRLLPKLDRSLERARRCEARVVVFGHWHIPLVYQAQGVMVVNPGALAAGNWVTRQLRRSVAQLLVRKDGALWVRHLDIDQSTPDFTPKIDWNAGFKAAFAQVTTSILTPDLERRWSQLSAQLAAFGYERTLPALLRVAHRCWAGQEAVITRSAWLAEIAADEELTAQWKARYQTLLRDG
jgi:hypothetical protein